MSEVVVLLDLIKRQRSDKYRTFTMNAIWKYINPIARLGLAKYSPVPAIVFTSLMCVLVEFYNIVIRNEPDLVTFNIIFILLGIVIYFAFRDGVIGGLSATAVAVVYFTYLIITKIDPRSDQMDAAELALVIITLYLFASLVIGWLKQTIDKLIEREANEKIRLQSIIEQLPVGVVITDEHGRVVNGNKKVNEIVGTQIKKGLHVGKEMFIKAYSNGKLLSPAQWPISKVLTSNRPVVGDELVVYQDDGKKVHLQVSASLIRNKKGKIIAVASIINDITERKELEERKDDFVNMASHELKTPITSNKIYLDLLSNFIDKNEKEKALKTVASIKYQTERLQELVSDLLDVSRLQTGKLSLRKETFYIKDVIAETTNQLQESVKQELSFSTKVNPKVSADKFRIYQVLTNLITNAAKYSPKDSKILIKLQQDKHKVIVSVQDFGLGITKHQQKKIFERLYQVTDSKEKTFPGLGMGLYISKEIIRKHRGKIWVESKKDHGSTFYFSLPRTTKV